MENPIKTRTYKASAALVLALVMVLMMALAWLVSVSLGSAQAQSYPSRPVKLISPFPPGGGVDIVGRLVAQTVGPRLGQQVNLENMSGASGQIGTLAVARAAADGYTLLFAPPTPITIAEHFEPRPQYDLKRDFAVIGMIGRNPGVIVVNATAIKAADLKSFIALARSQPGKIFYGSPGQGHAFHLSTELFAREAGIQLSHVPYKGSGPAVIGLIAGDVQFMVQSVEAVKEHIRAGKVRALATLESTRLEAFPQLPTLAESGLKNLNVVNWYGVFAPARTPRDILARWEKELLALPQDATFVARMREMSFDPIALGSADFVRMLDGEREQWASVIKAAGVSTAKN
jgi:tripartite-type tricarboxylate transporter receptor subunit TctC